VPVLVEMEYHPFVLSAVIPASDILARHLYLEQKAKPTERVVAVGGTLAICGGGRLTCFLIA